MTFYLTLTFVVFALFLSGPQEDLDTHIAFVNFVVHYLIPIVLLVDWFLDPPRHRLGMGVALAWLAYPLAWFAYTLARGSWADWYPYPFVDVDRHGYGGVLGRGVVFVRLCDRRGSVRVAQRSPVRIGTRADRVTLRRCDDSGPGVPPAGRGLSLRNDRVAL